MNVSALTGISAYEKYAYMNMCNARMCLIRRHIKKNFTVDWYVLLLNVKPNS
jgi:hypothetical protein